MKRAKNAGSGLIVVAVGVALFLVPTAFNALEGAISTATGSWIVFVMNPGQAAVFMVFGGLVAAGGLYLTFLFLTQSRADIEAVEAREAARTAAAAKDSESAAAAWLQEGRDGSGDAAAPEGTSGVRGQEEWEH